MVVNRRKKNSRQRGSWTHGWGAKKKHRGSGHRGGKGMAGSGKRSDAKKPSIWAERYFGKRGFKFKGKRIEEKPINLATLESSIERFVTENLVSKEGEVYVIELAKLGFNKLLGDGKATKKLKITVNKASKKAIEKVKNSGGEVILPAEDSPKE